jgi:hypothetical protein
MTVRDPATIAGNIESLRRAVDPSVIHGTNKVAVRIAALRDLLAEYDRVNHHRAWEER